MSIKYDSSGNPVPCGNCGDEWANGLNADLCDQCDHDSYMADFYDNALINGSPVCSAAHQ